MQKHIVEVDKMGSKTIQLEKKFWGKKFCESDVLHDQRPRLSMVLRNVPCTLIPQSYDTY